MWINIKISGLKRLGGKGLNEKTRMQIRCEEDLLEASCFGAGGKVEVGDYLSRPFTNMGTDIPYSFHVLCVGTFMFGITEASSK